MKTKVSLKYFVSYCRLQGQGLLDSSYDSRAYGVLFVKIGARISE